MKPVLEIVGPVHTLPGCIHGIGQPCALGLLRVREKAELPASIADVLGLPRGLAKRIDARPQGENALARSLLDAYVHLSWQARIPVHDKVSLTRGRQADGWVEFRFVVGSWSSDATRTILTWILARFNDAIQGVSPALRGDPTGVLASVRPHAFGGVNTFSMVLAALRTGCHVHRLDQRTSVLGTGVHSRWVQSLSTDRTSSMSLAFAHSKSDTARLLRQAGLPGALHRLVSTAEEALEACVAIGYPVVVKPNDQEQGRGVVAGLEQPAEVALAFSAALQFGPRVLVERHAQGFTHRLTVAFGEVIRVVRRIPGGITGDGVSSVSDLLLAQQQTSLWRERVRVTGLPGTTLDAEALEMLSRQTLTPQSVVSSGQFVPLRRRDNFTAGGTNVDLSLADIHPDNLRMAKDAAAMLRLDIAGIDFITTDIAQSWITHGGTVCEINGIPQLYAATDDPIYEAILSRMFPDGSGVPAILRIVDEAPDAAQIGSAVAEVARHGGNMVAAVSGLRVDGHVATAHFESGFEAARAALIRQDCRGVICILTVAEILRRGLPIATWSHASCSEALTVKWPTLASNDRAKLRYILAGIQVAGLH
jgi:cyanophycin synthetase